MVGLSGRRVFVIRIAQIVAVVIVVALLAPGTVQAPKVPTGKLKGYVTDATTSLPMEGVRVGLYRTIGTYWTDITYTDDVGYYEFLKVPVGTYRLTAYETGYETQVHNDVEIIQRVTVWEHFSMEPVFRGSVDGFLVNSVTGQPVLALASIRVYLTAIGGSPSYSSHIGFIEDQMTGYFDFEEVDVGSYILSITADGYYDYIHPAIVEVNLDQWTHLADLYMNPIPDWLPFGLTKAASVWDGSEVLLFGGLGLYDRNQIIKFDVATGSSVCIRNPFTEGRNQLSAVWTGDFAYAFGGESYSGNPLDEVVRFDPLTNQTTTYTGCLPEAVMGASAAWTGEYAFLFGGTDGTAYGYKDSIIRFDPATNTATTMSAQLPSSRTTTSALYDGSDVYIFGGRGSYGDVAEVLRYDPAIDEIEVLSCQLPGDVHMGSSVWTGDYALVFCQNSDSVLKFVPPTEEIVTLSRGLPEARYDFSVVYDGQTAYVLGGINDTSQSSQVMRYHDHSLMVDYGVDSQFLYIGGTVNAANGNLVIRETDLSLTGKGFQIDFTRTYNALEHLNTDLHNLTCGPRAGMLGWGWTHNYNTNIRELPNGDVVFTEECGSMHTFTWDLMEEVYTRPPGLSHRLTKDPSTGNFTLWQLDGSTKQFNETGRLVSITNKNGLMLHVDYDEYGRLLQVRDEADNCLNFTYWTDWMGGTDPYRVKYVSDSSGRVMFYDYYTAGIGHALTYTRLEGRLVETTYTYYLPEPEEGYLGTLPLRTINKAVEDRVIGDVIPFTVTGVDTTEFVYDEYQRVTEVWKSETRSGSWEPLYPPVCKYSFDYINTTNTEVTCALGGVLAVTMSAEGFPVFISGPPMVNSPTCGGGCSGGVSYPGKSGNENLALSWNKDFLMIESTDAEGNSHSLEYDAYGLLVNMTDSLDHSRLFEYEIIETAEQYLSVLATSIDAMGHSTRYFYDDRGNLNRTIDALGNCAELFFDEEGYIAWSKDALGNTTLFEYDESGMLSNITNPVGDATQYVSDVVGDYSQVIDPLDNNWTIERSGLRYEIVRSTDPTGNYSEKELNWRDDVIAFTDMSGNTTTYVNNITIGKLDSVTNALGDEIRYYYSSMGFLMSVVDANGHSTNYSYDSYARLKNVTLPMGQVYEYSYDHAGNVISVEYPNGSSVSYTYDALNRLKTTEYPGNVVVIRAYDANGNLVNISGPGSWKNITYDALNRPTNIRTYINFQNSQGSPLDHLTTEEIEYDANGNVVEDRIYDACYEVVNYYDYDPQNRVSTMTTDTTDGDSYAWQFYYDSIGRCVNVNATYGELDPYYNTTYAYDSRGNLLTISVSTDGVFTPYSHEYTYDSMSHLVEARDPLPGGVVTSYEYDEIGQLVGYVDDGLGTDLVYDSVGNRIEKTVELEGSTTFSYDANDRLESSSDGITYDYDENGNCIREYYYDGGELYDKTFTYDYNNRLIRVNSSSAILAIYNYTVDGLLASSDSAWPTSTLVSYVHSYSHAFGLPQEVMRLKDGTDYDIMWWGPGVDQILAIGLYDGGPHHTFVDGLGNTRHLINAEDGSLLGSQSYTPFGEMTESAWYRAPSFQGRFFDPATGLYDFRDRHYSAETGRYTTRPSDPKHGESDYLFPGNDPVNNRDPTGHPTSTPTFMLTKWYEDDFSFYAPHNPIWMTHEEIGTYLAWFWNNYWVPTPNWECVVDWILDASWDLGSAFLSRQSCLEILGSAIAAGAIAIAVNTYVKIPWLWAMGVTLDLLVNVWGVMDCIGWLMNQPFTPPGCIPYTLEPNPYW